MLAGRGHYPSRFFLRMRSDHNAHPDLAAHASCAPPNDDEGRKRPGPNTARAGTPPPARIGLAP